MLYINYSRGEINNLSINNYKSWFIMYNYWAISIFSRLLLLNSNRIEGGNTYDIVIPTSNNLIVVALKYFQAFNSLTGVFRYQINLLNDRSWRSKLGKNKMLYVK